MKKPKTKPEPPFNVLISLNGAPTAAAAGAHAALRRRSQAAENVLI